MGSIVTSGGLNSLRRVYFKTSPAFWFILLSQYLCMLDFCLSILQELQMNMATYRCLIPPSSFNYSADVIYLLELLGLYAKECCTLNSK